MTLRLRRKRQTTARSTPPTRTPDAWSARGRNPGTRGGQLASLLTAGAALAVVGLVWLVSSSPALAVAADAGPALTAQASTGQLRWLPYRPSSHETRNRLTVAARSPQARPLAAANPVRQAQANPFDDPFGDRSRAARAAEPVGLYAQNPAAPAGVAPPAMGPAPTDSPPLSDPEPTLPRVTLPATPQPPLKDNSPDATLPDMPRALPDAEPAAPSAPSPGREIKIDFKCRSAKDLPRIGDLTDNIAVPDDLQKYRAVIRRDLTCGLGTGQFSKRELEGWAPTTFTWKASGLCHKPLYFEQAHAERYGHSTGPLIHPFVAAGHFFVTIPVLPYKMGLYPPHECMYTLGYYRPGSCAPYYLDPIPLSVRAGLIEAGAWLGAVYIIP